jgi:hypothetical protein
MAKDLCQITCLFGLAAFVAASVGAVGEADGAPDMYLASEAPAVVRSIALSGEDSWNRSPNSPSEATVTRKSDTTGLAQRGENRAACRSARRERCED